jgi:hypothetical protein
MSRIITVATYLRTLKTLHTALLVGMILFASIAVILLGTGSFVVPQPDELHSIFRFVAPLMAVACFFGSTLLFKKKIDALNAKPQNNLGNKLRQYQAASILRWALLEAAVLTSIIALLLTGKYVYYGSIIFVLLVFFIMYAPTADKIPAQVQMSSQERQQFDDDLTELYEVGSDRYNP